MSIRSQRSVPALANTYRAWTRLSKETQSPFIRSLEEFDAIVAGRKHLQSPLGNLPIAAQKEFRSHLRFVNISVNGVPRNRYLLSFYCGDLVKKHGLSEKQLEQVAALFGIGPKLFGQLYHYFGDFGPNEQIICRKRPYFFCGRHIP
jgi:hypothetical protein